jgi:hypothetical protein
MEIEAYYPKLVVTTLRRYYDSRLRKQSLYFDMAPELHGAPETPPTDDEDRPAFVVGDGVLPDLGRNEDATTHSDAEEPAQSFRVRSGTEISDALGVHRYRLLQRHRSTTSTAAVTVNDDKAKVGETMQQAVITQPPTVEHELSDYEDCLSRKSSESHRRHGAEHQQEEEEEEEEGPSRKTSDYFDPVD